MSEIKDTNSVPKADYLVMYEDAEALIHSGSFCADCVNDLGDQGGVIDVWPLDNPAKCEGEHERG